MRQKLRLLLCIIFGHNWKYCKTNEIDITSMDFQPSIVVIADGIEGGLAEIYSSYYKCQRCQLVESGITTHAGFIGVTN